MPVTVERRELDAIYTIVGPLDARAGHRLLDLNWHDYNEVGDALGAIIDIRQASLTVAGVRLVQKRLDGVVFDAPVAIVGSPNSVFITFLQTLDALTSRGRRRFSLLTNVEEARDWIAQWYLENGKERDALRGQVTTIVKPLYYPGEPPDE
jgi:hypothetical protein